jgi:ANTAR domain
VTVLPADDLGLDSAELRRLSPAGTLSRLAALAVREVPGCSAAHVTVWRDGELAEVAATHPDAAALVDLERASPDALAGPLTAAARGCLPVSCADTLAEDRWPGWAAGALARGVRGCTCLVRELPPVTLVLALLSVRPQALDAASAGVADLLAGLGGAALILAMDYGQAQRTATQLQDSIAARAITDQAKGILIHALGCGADEALAHLRRLAQRRNLKVTEVAAEVIAAYGGGPARA